MEHKPILFAGPMILALAKNIKDQTRRVLKPQPATEDFRQPCFYNPSVTDKNGEYQPGLEVFGISSKDGEWGIKLPHTPRHLLWVKETWCDVNAYGAPGIAYRADGLTLDLMDREDFHDAQGAFNYYDPRLSATQQRYSFAIWSHDLIGGKQSGWRPSIFMPKWASRYTAEVSKVRVERLRDISEEDAKAEGIYWQEPSEADREWAKHFAEENGGSSEIRGVYVVPGTKIWATTARDAFRQLWNSINAAPKPQYAVTRGKRSITSYVSYPWEGEERTEEFRGKPHHIIANPWVSVTHFKTFHRNVEHLKNWELSS
ncbi:hypothetical protein ACMG4P_04765 [Pseudovibrio denitrificans]|uniref:hypothetical protein n=1 Tax=Pseudovibrio denitrificans TaxID=258256 RepID=UPI0039BFDC61